MSERTYIDEIVDALFEGRNHRKYVLQEVQSRIVEQMDKLTKLILNNKTNSSDWWKDKLIMSDELPKENIIWFGGLNNKTIGNMMGSTAIKVCREVCSENHDAIMSLLKDLPEDFPIPTINFKIKDEKTNLNEAESFLFLFTMMSMAKALTGGIWSEIGKQAADKFITIVFEKLEIPRNDSSELYYELTETVKKGEIDARIYYKCEPILEIEIKILGGGNPEIAREAIALEPDIFIVDVISSKMQNVAEEKNIRIVHFNEVLEELPKILNEKGIKLSVN